MQVNVNIESKEWANLENLNIIQGDLKSLSEENYQKLKLQILDEGFISPFYVWDDNGTLNLLDGTQRKITLERMLSEGIGMPEKFPIIKIPARNANHAARLILAISSQYGKVSEESINKFNEKFEIYDMTPFDFDALPLKNMIKLDEHGLEENSSIDIDENKKYIIEVQFPNDMEMMDIHDDLLHRGYIVRIK